MSRIGVHLTEDLLKELDTLFPLRNIPLGMSLDELRYVSGQRSVVEFLWSAFLETQENILENTNV